MVIFNVKCVRRYTPAVTAKLFSDMSCLFPSMVIIYRRL